MEAERHPHNVKKYCSDLTALSDPQWQAQRHALPGTATEAYGTSEYPRKRQAFAQNLPGQPCTGDACCVQSSSRAMHPPARAAELQCCAQPALMQQTHQQSGHEQGGSLQSSSAVDTIEAASSRLQHTSRPDAYFAEQQEQSRPGPALMHSNEHEHEGQAEFTGPASEAEHGSIKQGPKELSLIMEDDGGYVIPVVMTNTDIRMPVSAPAGVARSRAEPEAQAGRPRRSRAAALACQVRPPLLHDTCMAHMQGPSLDLQCSVILAGALHRGPLSEGTCTQNLKCHTCIWLSQPMGTKYSAL